MCNSSSSCWLGDSAAGVHWITIQAVQQLSFVEAWPSWRRDPSECCAGPTFKSRTPASGLASNSICTASRVAQQMAHHWCVYQGMVLEQLSTSETSPRFVGTSERLLWTLSALACQVTVCNHLVYCLLQCNAHWHPLQSHHCGHASNVHDHIHGCA